MKKIFSLTLSFVLGLLAAPAIASDCMNTTLLRGTDQSQSKEMSKRCSNASDNKKECRQSADTIKDAMAQVQQSIRETCAKQAKNVQLSAKQSKLQGNNSEIDKDASQFSTGIGTRLGAAAETADKGKEEAQKAADKVMENPKKVDPARKDLLQRIFRKFAKSNYSGVSSSEQYARALKEIDAAWKDLQSNPDISNDASADAYDATANYLNAEEVRLAASYQKNQMTAASQALQEKADIADKNSKGFNETKSDSKNGMMGTIGTLGTLAGAAGGLATLANAMKSNNISGADTGNSSISSGVGETSALAGADLSGGGNAIDAGKLAIGEKNGAGNEAASQISGMGFNAPNGAESDVNVTAASRLDTSLRDSLKSKLLAGDGGDAALEATASNKVTSKDSKAAQNAPLRDAAGVPILSTGGPEFLMARSETDEAVKDLLETFKEEEKNEYATAADSAEEGAGRRPASVTSNSAAGIEGQDGSSLFKRVRSTVSRCVKKGCVVNGLQKRI